MDYVKVGASQCMNHSLIIRFHFGIFPDVLEKLVSYWMLYQNNCSNLLLFLLRRASSSLCETFSITLTHALGFQILYNCWSEPFEVRSSNFRNQRNKCFLNKRYLLLHVFWSSFSTYPSWHLQMYESSLLTQICSQPWATDLQTSLSRKNWNIYMCST